MASSTQTAPPPTANAHYTRSAEHTVLGHPTGLFVLFFAELWERFSWYGLKALLVLYMTKALQFTDDRAYGIFGAYGGFAYATPLLGGLLADRLLGYRRAIVLGGSLMALGHFAMAVEHPLFFYGSLALIIAGNGMFKPNISTLVGTLYGPNDARRDGAFTIFYMGINVGAGLAPLACGYLGERVGWHYGFALAGVGMVGGLCVFLWGRRFLGEHGLAPRRGGAPDAPRYGFGPVVAVVAGVLAFLPLAGYLLTQPKWVEHGMYVLGPLFLAYVVFEALRCEAADRSRILVIIVLALFSVFFWACFEQAGSSMSLFTDRVVDRHVWGFEIPTTWFLSVNPAFICILGIPVAMLWGWLAKARCEPSTPVKFGFGLLQLSLGFVAMVIAARQANAHGSAHLGWLVLAYFLHTTGELCLSPVGLSAVTKLSPARLCGLMMGFWFFCTAFAGVAGGVIARFTSGDAGYENVFRMIVYVAAGAGVLMLLISPGIKRMMRTGK